MWSCLPNSFNAYTIDATATYNALTGCVEAAHPKTHSYICSSLPRPSPRLQWSCWPSLCACLRVSVSTKKLSLSLFVLTTYLPLSPIGWSVRATSFVCSRTRAWRCSHAVHVESGSGTSMFSRVHVSKEGRVPKKDQTKLVFSALASTIVELVGAERVTRGSYRNRRGSRRYQTRSDIL